MLIYATLWDPTSLMLLFLFIFPCNKYILSQCIWLNFVWIRVTQTKIWHGSGSRSNDIGHSPYQHMHALCDYVFRPIAWILACGIWKDWQQNIKLDDVVSDSVPQGIPPWPFTFHFVMTGKLIKNIQDKFPTCHHCHCYADNTQSYISFKPNIVNSGKNISFWDMH